MSLFLDTQHAIKNNIQLIKKTIPLTLEVVDGRPISSGQVTHQTVPLEVRIGQHVEHLVFNITKLGHYPVILGMPWLKRHDPTIVWSQHQVSFASKYCAANCLSLPITVQALPEHPYLSPNYIEKPTKISTSKSVVPKIYMVSAASFRRSYKNAQVLLLKATDLQPTISEHDAKIDIPAEYQEYSDVFSKAEADKLPEHRPYDHSIPLQNDTSPPFGPIYGLSEVELKALREYLDENLGKGFITASSSPAGAPILFIKKKDGNLRLCVDYRGLNGITVKNRYPLPLISEMLNRVGKARYFTKIDLRGAYNLVRIKSGEEWKTAFRCRYGHFEYRVMPFGLTNAPATFQHFMNDTLRNFLDDFCVVYLDDILVYSQTMDDHRSHVRQILDRLREARLYAKLEKCCFHVEEVEFLGYIISSKGIRMDPAKISSITSWPIPRSVHDIQVFIGFANFYRRFIFNYSNVLRPITSLLKKNVPFSWSSIAQESFDLLKTAFTTAPVLQHFDPSLPSIVEADSSDFALACILSQRNANGVLHPVAFYSRKLSSAEMNYDIYDKEMLAIVTAFKEWRCYLEGCAHKITVLTDHRNLEWFTTTKNYSRRQARWGELLGGYDFVIVYRPGTKGGKPDALSRRPDYQTTEGESTSRNHPRALLKPHQFVISATTVSKLTSDEDLTHRIKAALKNDAFIGPYLNYLEDSTIERPAEVNDLLSSYSMVDGLVLFKQVVFIPDDNSIKLTILRQNHDSSAAGHFGQDKTLELISRDFYWHNIRQFVNDYIRSCDTCNRNKTPRHKKFGKLQPLPIPSQPWSSVSLDFIVELPKSAGFNAVLVVVDRLTKMSHFIPTNTTVNAEETANLYFRHVFKYHGFPEDIVSDRGTQFTSKFWSRLMSLCNIQRNMSTAYHPQSDGQTERVNQTLEQYLRIFCDYQQDNWQQLLTLAEFTYNNSKHSSTQVSPFYANFGYHPNFRLKTIHSQLTPAAESFVEKLKDVHRELKDQLSNAQKNYEKYYNMKVEHAPNFVVGQRVWLLRRHIHTTRPSDKLDFKRLGPFQIKRIIGAGKLAIELDLPSSMKIHPVFHVSLLEPYHESTIPDRVLPPSPPVEVNGQQEWVVKSILDSRLRRNKLEYLVDWEGWEPSDRTWEPMENLENSPDIVKDFHDRYPSKAAAKDIRSRRARS
jgi:RNase H-like domain found in reverse transcriptase/Reverse transcriptase (RNA-dependent DNA polymerase)/Integrase zinc binding domain/Chromo (CHRromatin Organisation MOdifier) domain